MVRQWGSSNISVHGQNVRTNNSVESFHKFFFALVGRAHPNVWAFLTKYINMEHIKAVQLIRRARGEELPPRQRAKYIRQNEAILRAQNQFGIDGNIDKFLTTMCRSTDRLVADFDPGKANLIIFYLRFLYGQVYIWCCRFR